MRSPPSATSPRVLFLDSTWGRVRLVMDGSGRVVGLNLPFLQTRPRIPFAFRESQGVPAEPKTRPCAQLSDLPRWFPAALPEGTPFQRSIWSALCAVPPGTTCTYGELASAAGFPHAARAAGSACGANPLPVFIPCHRAVARNGLGGFSAGLPWKELLLEEERVRSICTLA